MQVRIEEQDQPASLEQLLKTPMVIVTLSAKGFEPTTFQMRVQLILQLILKKGFFLLGYSFRVSL